MGNCLRHESGTQWAGDDWGSPPRDEFFGGEAKRGATGDQKKATMEMEDMRKGTATTTEVKVKITKKQLEKLLSRVDLKELSVEQVLEELINVADRCDHTNQRSWRPALQSIPEVN
ncbi:uncharacterized protein LOC110810949 [Carica papaya]|uniref:uncharacterized protein LOC110810949 n=1 Tax=Carica papaya TaxID=3649 RepID=UPI000B8C91E4|nr:uncharacterized protein LOC110810949 [Carica papaya]